uniref:Conotoxin-like unassigned superfamily 15 n=1 Tax=Conus ermineus TaxID=55423 RepID=A0A346CIN6_CONER|nr:conotoxin-like precursor unassigned superfamily 15 [Conus ermineus]
MSVVYCKPSVPVDSVSSNFCVRGPDNGHQARLPDKAFRQRQSQYIQRIQRCPWCGHSCCYPNYCQGVTCKIA